MAKFLFLILSLSFVLQSSGTALVFKKFDQTTEQCPDDNKTGEESGKATFKKDQEQLNQFLCPGNSFAVLSPTTSETIHFYPSGFYSQPFMPPR